MSELLIGYIQASSGALLTDRCARAASMHGRDWTLGLKAQRPLPPEVKKVNPGPASAVCKSNKGACSVSTQRSEGGLDG